MKKTLLNFFYKLLILKELLQFFWENKLWWIIPIFLIILFLMILVMFGQTTGLAPFIYPLF